MVYRLGELFCGAGGMALGAMMADVKGHSIEHAWATDINKDACVTYRHNLCPDRPETVIQGDIRTMDIETVLTEPIDGFAFGFPCNDFSTIGSFKGLDGEYAPLYQYGVKILRLFQPMWFVAENVRGLISANKGEAFKIITKDLADAGYTLTAHLFKFDQYGIPQTRHRVIIVGIRHDLSAKGIKYLPPSPMPYAHIDVSIKTALSDIPPDAPNNEQLPVSETTKQRIKFVPPGQTLYNVHDLVPDGFKIKRKMFFRNLYQRLLPDKPCMTIKADFRPSSQLYHWEEDRPLNLRETARIQTFPNYFLFLGSKTSVQSQIGMAVPPQGAKIIFESILNTFAGKFYPKVEPNITIPSD